MTYKPTDNKTFININKKLYKEFKVEKPNVGLFKEIDKMKYKSYKINCVVKNNKFLIVLLEYLYTKLEALDKTEKNISISNNDFSKLFIHPNLIYNFEESRKTFEITKYFNNKKNYNYEDSVNKIINKCSHSDQVENESDKCHLIPMQYYSKVDDEGYIQFNLYQKVLKRETNDDDFINYDDAESAYQFTISELDKLGLKM